MSEKTGLELTREAVKRIREDMKKAGGTMTVDGLYSEIDEREAFEKWLGIKPCGAAHDFGWAAWKARAALAVTPAADAPTSLPRCCDLLSTTIGVLMGQREKIGYTDSSPIASVVKEAVEYLRPWPETLPAAAPVVLPEPAGYLVTKLEAPIVGSELKINRSIYTKNEPTGKHQKLYTEQQVRALLATGGQGKSVEEVDPVQAAADAASVGHLCGLLDHQSQILARAMDAVKALELTASPIDESNGDMDARIPYEAWATFVDARAALLHYVAQSPVAAPQQADARDAERLRFLVEDHASKEAREARNAICERLPVMSYSAACADIDAAIAATKEGKQHG